MRLTSRETTAVSLGSALLLVTVAWLWVIEPMRDYMNTLDRGLLVQQDRYRQLLSLSQTHTALSRDIAETEKRIRRSGDFSILSHLEAEADRMGVRRHIVQMKPKPGQSTRFYKENQVEIRMEKISLSLLLGYLHKIETAQELMRIRELRIRTRFDNPNYLDVRFQVSAFDILEPER